MEGIFVTNTTKMPCIFLCEARKIRLSRGFKIEHLLPLNHLLAGIFHTRAVREGSYPKSDD